MDFIENLHLDDALHAVSQCLIIPTVALLLLLFIYAVYTLGSLIIEVFQERKHYKVVLPQLIANLDAAPYEKLDAVVQKSGLLKTQRDALHQLISFMYLPNDALTEVAKRLLADESERYQKALGTSEAAAKVAPMLGLMGTLIPLGPGILALSSGNLETLSSALLVAFDTTVAGLAVAVVCYLVTRVRARWYESYLVSIEGAMNTLLEKAANWREMGLDLPVPKSAQTTGQTLALKKQQKGELNHG